MLVLAQLQKGAEVGVYTERVSWTAASTEILGVTIYKGRFPGVVVLQLLVWFRSVPVV